jgi:hypothetical protein
MIFLLDCRAAGAATLIWFVMASCGAPSAPSEAAPGAPAVAGEKLDDFGCFDCHMKSD